MKHIDRPFDKVKDMCEVDPFGWCNLSAAYANGVVSPDMTAAELGFNHISDPESIIGKPSDEFDAIKMQKTIRERGVKSSEVKPSE